MITIDGKTKYGTKNITGTGFGLIHNDIKVIALIKGTEKLVTSTNHNVEEFNVEQKALDRITELGLEYTPPDMEDKPPERIKNELV
jgi:hypothetical protein